MSDFDDIFKDSFQDFEMDVPDDMWSRIQDAQDPEDVNHPFWYTNKLWLSTLIIIGLENFRI